VRDLQPSRLGLAAAILGSLLFCGSLGLFQYGGGASNAKPLIELFSSNPGLFGTAYRIA
jgi:hypothetical protein